MRRIIALLFGVLAGLAAVRFLRRRRDVDTSGAGDAASDGADADNRAAELRRKLDEARRSDDAGADSQDGVTVGEARIATDADVADSAPATAAEESGVPAGNGGSTVQELAERRAKVHGRARSARIDSAASRARP